MGHGHTGELMEETRPTVLRRQSPSTYPAPAHPCPRSHLALVPSLIPSLLCSSSLQVLVVVGLLAVAGLAYVGHTRFGAMSSDTAGVETVATVGWCRSTPG